MEKENGDVEMEDVEEIAAPIYNSPQWENTLKKAIPSIVSIRSMSVRSFDTETQRTSQATGFVVDAELGIILTNRHVVQPGPIIADAIFTHNKEEIKLIPIYRDPVHDFGFYKFNVNDIKYMTVVRTNLGEKLSILSGTIARLDRKAPNYGIANYSDWNTFYYQSASMTSGGSSGSPVLDIEGNAVALNAGGATKSASSFFLPLERVVRALDFIKKNLPVPRGTIQTIFQHSPYDELKRLGLDFETESFLRKEYPDITGMMAVKLILPKGPADGLLQSGDILLKINGTIITDFFAIEEFFDTNINQNLKFTVQRGSHQIEREISVQDLHSITPDTYVEVGGGIVHTLSYQMARSFMVPVSGVFIASSGYMFGEGGIPRKSIITKVNNLPTNTLEEFIHVLSTLKESERVPYVTGYWNYSDLAKCFEPATISPQTAKSLDVDDTLGPAKYVVKSLVYVQATLPYKIDGIAYQNTGGFGLVLDAEKGYIYVNRKTCPTSICDILVTFVNSIIIPAKFVYLHQYGNFAIIQYNPKLLGNTVVESAKLSDTPLVKGDSTFLVCLTKSYEVLVRKTIVTNIRPCFVNETLPPTYRPMNIEGMEFENPIGRGGVLANAKGEIQGIHSIFTNYSPKKTTDFYMGLDVATVKPILKELQEGRLPQIYWLEAELTYIQIAQARVLGLNSEWVEKFEHHDSKRRNILLIRRTSSESPTAAKLLPGDIILTVQNCICSTFNDVVSKISSNSVEMKILREGNEIDVVVDLNLMKTTGTERIVSWAGAVFQMPQIAVYQQMQNVPTGVLCSLVSSGSPAALYGISPLDWIVQINDTTITDLDSFLAVLSDIPEDTFVRIKTINYQRFENVLTLRTNTHYFGLSQLTKDVNVSFGWKLESF
ncbi:serine protease [Boothiomyces sp. JEL0866]|nr:serine protease [Boothiomyces sp. JEL0866]